MRKRTKKQAELQWHPAFYAGIQIEFSKETEKLIFENEHQLGTKPKEIDVLIIKKNSEDPLEKNIGKIFRKYNIIEYKSPTDYLSIDDFYKVYAYADFYKSDTPREDSIKIDEITISLVCKRYPKKLAAHLKYVRHFEISRFEKGIYYITGDIIPMQLIVISELSKGNNFWLRSLTNDIRNRKEAEEIVREYQEHEGNKLYHSVMDIIVHANEERFEEVKHMSMCQALRDLFKDELEEGMKLATSQGLQRGMQQGMQQARRSDICALVEIHKEQGLPCVDIVKRLCQKLELSEEETAMYLQECR